MFLPHRIHHINGFVPSLALCVLSLKARSAAFAFQSTIPQRSKKFPFYPPAPLLASTPSFSRRCHWSQLSALEGNSNAPKNEMNAKYDKMILRVRSNLGMTKLTIVNQNDATETNVREALLRERHQKTGKTFQLSQDLSFDPAGSRLLDSEKSLREQGIVHGDMLYCRLEETEIPNDEMNLSSIDDSRSTNGVASSSLATKAEFSVENDVIDLVDSSDDEDDLQDMDSAVAKEVAIRLSESKKKSKGRKRPRSETNGTNSKKSDAMYSTTNTDRCSDFQIASYNVWFGPPDPEAKQVFPRERMKGIVECLYTMASKSTSPLFFVGLQELTPSLVQYLEPLFKTIGFELKTQSIGGLGHPPYGIGIAFPNDMKVMECRFVPYSNSIQGRGFIYVRTSSILFATTHLESWCGPQLTGAKEREVQLVELARFCEEQLCGSDLNLAIITGDLNWDDERKRKPEETPNQKLLSLLSPIWKDAGTPFDYTYDAKQNPMLSGSLRRRFDRCIYTTGQSNVDTLEGSHQKFESKGLEKVGTRSIPNLIWNKRNPYNGSIKKMPVAPSDHFGILVSFSSN